MHHHLASIRQAHRDRIDAAAVRADRLRRAGHEPAGIPGRLFYAGCWLAEQGVPDDGRCAGERQFRVDMAYYRSFLAGLPAGDPMRAEVLRIGHDAIYGRHHPIFVPLALDLAA